MTHPASHLSRLFRAVRLAGSLTAVLVIASCGPDRASSPGQPATEAGGPLATTVRTTDGLEFDAVLDRPDPARANGWGVLLIGGGMGNDLDWTTSGSITADGQQIQLTIDGQSHADGPTISSALVEQGFVVLRWSTLARGDPLASEWPMQATPRSLSELTDQTRAALQTLRDIGAPDDGRVILLGHSLGAARACTIAAEDLGVAGLILLSPAYFADRPNTPAMFANEGLRFGAAVLRERAIPCLALIGSLDPSRAVDGAGIVTLAGQPRYESLEAHVLAGLGHQLGPTAQGREGPIDPDAVSRLANWAAKVAEQ